MNTLLKITKIVTGTGLLILLLMPACTTDKKSFPEESVKHLLRKFNVKTSISEHTSAYYFLVMGGYSSSKNEQKKVRFYFQNCLGEYQFLELELKQIRIKTDTTKNPYVIMHMGRNNMSCQEIEYDFQINYVTIHCKESDFQPEININDLR